MSDYSSQFNRYTKPLIQTVELEGDYLFWYRVFVKFLKGTVLSNDYATSFTPVTVSNFGTVLLYESTHRGLVYVDKAGNIASEVVERVNYYETFASLLGTYRAFYGGSTYGSVTTNINIYSFATLLQTISFINDFPMVNGCSGVVFSPNGKYFAVSCCTNFATNRPYNWVALYSADSIDAAIPPVPLQFDGFTLFDRNLASAVSQYLINFLNINASNIKIRVSDPNGYLDAISFETSYGAYENALNVFTADAIGWVSNGTTNSTLSAYSFAAFRCNIDAATTFPARSCVRFSVDATCTVNGNPQSFSTVLAIYLNSS